MRVLLTGASGFIGSHLADRLCALGHEVIAVTRRPLHGTGMQSVAVDFAAASTPGAWEPLLGGIDVVINAVGIFRESEAQTFAALHVAAPRALFAACVNRGVERVIQISALGVERRATPYQQTKHAADECLLALPLHGVVVRPSLVFGAQGQSASRMLTMAAMPFLALPEGGKQLVQPVHVDDVVEAICGLVQADPARWSKTIVPLVGPEAVSLHGYLEALRRALGLGKAVMFEVPAPLADAAALLAGGRRGSLLDRAALTMLRQGNTASATPIRTLLGREPRAVAHLLDREPIDALRVRARLGWLIPALRLSLGAVWVITAVLSFGIFPREESLDLLARTGIPPSWRPWMLHGAALFDLALGILTLWPPSQPRQRVWLWAAQAGLIVAYTLIIAFRLPEFALHPFGPLLKNLPILAILLLLLILDRDARPPR